MIGRIGTRSGIVDKFRIVPLMNERRLSSALTSSTCRSNASSGEANTHAKSANRQSRW